MKFYLFLCTALIAACTSGPANKTAVETKPIPTIEQMSADQTEFIKEWSTQFNKKKLPVLDIFRNRYFTKTDLNELEKLLKKREVKVDFSAAKNYLQTKEELGTDTSLFSQMVWVKSEDVETCRKVDPKFWGCFGNRSDITSFYYLSMPLFSADKKWCLLSVNLNSKFENESYGGGRLYHLDNNKWEEVAFLSYWGKQPE